jgi:hypothetical protein
MLTVPVNPFSAVTLIVDVLGVPAFAGAGAVALIEKSTGGLNANVAVVPWVREPLVPVIVTEKLPGLWELHVRVALPEPGILPGLGTPHVKPPGTISVSPTVPVKPLIAVTVMVEVAA